MAQHGGPTTGGIGPSLVHPRLRQLAIGGCPSDQLAPHSRGVVHPADAGTAVGVVDLGVVSKPRVE